MKTTLDMGDVLEGFIRNRLTEIPFLHNHITHWDCQDTDGDGEVECYFYIESQHICNHGIRVFNDAIAKMLGVQITGMIEDDSETGHEGEYRFEYIVSLKSDETLD